MVAASLEITVATSSDGTAVPQVEQNRLSAAICEPQEIHRGIMFTNYWEVYAKIGSKRK